MKLIIYNGSPRGEVSNSNLLVTQLAKGYLSIQGNTCQTYHLARRYKMDTYVQTFKDADQVILAFPLYCDGMPGLVKEFIEGLEPYCGQPGNPSLGFIIQSGFPESNHLRPLEVYLGKLAFRLGTPYLGTVVRGGVEGILQQSEKENRKLFKAFENLGKNFGKNGRLDPAQIRDLSMMEKLPEWIIPFMIIFDALGFTKIDLIRRFKQNGVYERRFARPYMEE